VKVVVGEGRRVVVAERERLNFNFKPPNNPKNRKPTPPNEENNKKSQPFSSLESASERAVDHDP
jgi:hypothetical protein